MSLRLIAIGCFKTGHSCDLLCGVVAQILTACVLKPSRPSSPLLSMHALLFCPCYRYAICSTWIVSRTGSRSTISTLAHLLRITTRILITRVYNICVSDSSAFSKSQEYLQILDQLACLLPSTALRIIQFKKPLYTNRARANG